MSRTDKAITSYGDNFKIVVLTVDNPLHSMENSYCYSPSCPCHKDRTSIREAKQAVKDGLMTSKEALNYIRGKHI
ncbi:hypothetical protein KSD_31280 [Ktedonobacter sp. SOSP1-85]|nr:hypothetical protein KSD_31280 [Ktedonobacter sp. SOSP1-85]